MVKLTARHVNLKSSTKAINELRRRIIKHSTMTLYFFNGVFIIFLVLRQKFKAADHTILHLLATQESQLVVPGLEGY